MRQRLTTQKCEQGGSISHVF